MTDYTAKFLGIFLIGIPVLSFATIIVLVGLRWILKTLEKGEKENIFHHHFHYRDTKEKFLRRTNKKDEWL